MGATEDFLAAMAKKRKAQKDQIQSLFAAQQASAPEMAPAHTQPGLLGGIIHGVTGLLGGNAAQSKGQTVTNTGGGGAGPINGGAPMIGGAGIAGGPGASGGFSGILPSAGSLVAGAQGVSPIGGQMAATQMPIMAGMAGAPSAAPAAAASGTTTGASGLYNQIVSALASLFSSKHMKHEIEDYKQVGDLRWVRFKYLPEMDPEQKTRVGLIAEELVETHPELVWCTNDGDILGIHYGRLKADQWP